jgi:hypothetical protein
MQIIQMKTPCALDFGVNFLKLLETSPNKDPIHLIAHLCMWISVQENPKKISVTGQILGGNKIPLTISDGCLAIHLLAECGLPLGATRIVHGGSQKPLFCNIRNLMSYPAPHVCFINLVAKYPEQDLQAFLAGSKERESIEGLSKEFSECQAAFDACCEALRPLVLPPPQISGPVKK